MLIADANVLIYAVNATVPQHEVARSWLDGALDGHETVGFDWTALLAFIRITTRRAIMPSPLDVDVAFGIVEGWLAASPAQVVAPTERHVGVLRSLLAPSGTGGNLTSDAHLAALAIEHGAMLWTFDRDFARFAGLHWQLLAS